jgi:hypothetical protein
VPIGYDLSALTLDELRTLRGILGKAVPLEFVDVALVTPIQDSFLRGPGSIHALGYRPERHSLDPS